MRTIDIKTFKHQCGYETETECLQFLLNEAKPEIETLTKALQKTYENHDKQHHAKVIHQLKGATAFGYAPALYESCTALQKALKEDETTATCDALYQTVSQTLQAVQQDFEMLPAAIALENFLSEWDKQYQSKASILPLFNSDLSNQWSKAQQIKFAYLFYHARGHFNECLWLLGNNAPNKPYKGIVLENFNEEFGGDGLSHEALYFEFGKALGVDLMEERLNEQHYLPFLREFNHAHLDWLTHHAWHHQWAAFSAYERLDNVDYKNLLPVAESLTSKRRALAFFVVHSKAEHFANTYADLVAIWQKDEAAVRQAYDFIGSHQLTMWQTLSDTLGH